MTRHSRVSDAGLLLRHGAAAPVGAVLLALLVGVAVFAVAAAPRALSSLADRELDAELRTVSALESDLAFSGDLSIRSYPNQDAATTLRQLDREFELVPGAFDPVLRGITSSDEEWFAQLDVLLAGPLEDGRSARVRPIVDVDFLDRVRITAGAAPAPWVGDSSDRLKPEARPPIDILLSDDAATALGLVVGDVLASDPAPLRVGGTFEPVDAADPFWLHEPRLLVERDTRLPGGLTIAETSVFLSPSSLDTLSSEAQAAVLRLWYPTSPDSLEYDEADDLSIELRGVEASRLTLQSGQELRFATGLPRAIERVQERVTSASAMLALAGSAPLGVVFAVLLLSARSTTARRAAALRLASARGAGAGVLRSAALLEGLLIAVPTSAIALWAAVTLLPGPTTVGSLLPALLVAAAVPVYCAVAGRAALTAGDRLDLGGRSRRGRLTLEAGIVGLAVAALILLDRRGLLAASSAVGVDPLLAATPLLASLAVCVLVLRVYPLPLLALQRRMRTRTGAVGLLGAARAVRDRSLGFGSVLAIVVAVATAVFSVVLASTVAAGVDAAASQEVGADIRFDAAAIPASAVERVASVDGVADAVPVSIVPDTAVRSRSTTVIVTLVVADLESLARLGSVVPTRLDGEGAIPVIASDGFTERIRTSDLSLGDVQATRAATIGAAVIPGAGEQWILVDRADAGDLIGADPIATRLLVRLDAAAPASVVDRVRDVVVAELPERSESPVAVTDAASVSARIEGRPTVEALAATLWLSAAVALALGCLAIAVAAVGAAASRNRVVAVTRILGMSRRQLRGLVVWELAPALVMAGAAGTALGLALPVLVTSLVDLRTFVGGTVPLGPAAPVLPVLAIALGFAAVAAASGFIAVAVADRIDPASTVKIGAE